MELNASQMPRDCLGGEGGGMGGFGIEWYISPHTRADDLIKKIYKTAKLN